MAVLSITAASQGLTLTKASRVVLAEMHWTPSLMQQAEDRCHRNSQKNNVTCYYMFGESTLDNYIYKLISEKFHIVSNMIDGDFRTGRGFLNPEKNISKIDLEEETTHMTLEERIDHALKNKIYGSLTDIDLIRELIETEESARKSNANQTIKVKDPKVIEKQSKQELKKEDISIRKQKFGIKKYFENSNKQSKDKIARQHKIKYLKEIKYDHERALCRKKNFMEAFNRHQENRLSYKDSPEVKTKPYKKLQK